jgi:hypothetical protein
MLANSSFEAESNASLSGVSPHDGLHAPWERSHMLHAPEVRRAGRGQISFTLTADLKTNPE